MSKFEYTGKEEELDAQAEAEFKAAADGSQSALQFAAISESEKKGFRDELSKYLTDMKEKVGSDGQKLVHMSDEFDTVAEAMTRQDLLSDESAPWSKYLLSNDRAFEGTLSDAGRYDGLASEENDEAAAKEAQIRKEMARMELLEKQLRAASKKDAFVRRELIDLEYEQEGGDDVSDTMSDSSHASSTYSSATKRSGKSNRSVLSRFNDYTFLTRAKSDRSTSRGSDMQSLPASPMHSARTIESDDGEQEEEEAEAKLSTPERMRVRAERRALKQKATEELKKKALKGRSALSDDEELRVQNLLDVDEGSEAWKALGAYGTTLQREAIESYDEKLQRFGRLNRLVASDEAEVKASRQQEVAAGAGKEADYLAEQRLLKDRTRQISRIEDMIKAVAGDTIDLSGLVDKEAPSANDHDVQGKGQSLLEVPSYESVTPNRKITSVDVARLVEEVRLMRDEEGEGIGIENQEPQSDSDALSLQTRGTHESSRHKIDRLLGGLRPEIDRLGHLRNALHEVMCRSCAEGEKSRSMQRNGEIQRALMDLDDELVEMQNLYGTASSAAIRAQKTNISGKTLQPLNEQGTLHNKLRKLREKMADRGVYQQEYPIRTTAASEEEGPPPLPVPAAQTAFKIGFDPRLRRPIPSPRNVSEGDVVAVEDDDGGYLGEEIPTAVGGPSSPGHLKGSKLII